MGRPIVNRFKDAATLADQVASDLFDFVKAKLSTGHTVNVALTGGTIGIASLAAAKNLPFNILDLKRLHIWWGDERFVASDSPDRNSLQAQNAWLKYLDLPKENIHEFPSTDTERTLEQAAKDFNQYVLENNVHFDLMLMGMGPDGHIASLFPGKNEPAPGVAVFGESDSPKPPPLRLSFSFEFINTSDEIWFTVAGADKSDAVELAFGENPEQLPVGKVHGMNRTAWYLDQTAAVRVFGC